MLFFEKEYIEYIKESFNWDSYTNSINTKKYTVSDTPLSYRQINAMSNNKLLKNDRKNGRGWRKFSFKELVFLETVNELRRYGLKDKQLFDLKNSFCKKQPTDWEMIEDENFMKNDEMVSDIAIAAVLNNDNIFIMLDERCFVNYLYANDVTLYAEKYISSVFLCFSKIVSNVSDRLGQGQITYPHDSLNASIDEKEAKIINAIRYGNYESVKIKFSNGEADILEKTEDVNPQKRILEIRKEHKFQDMSIREEDGKIVSIKRTAKEKL